MLLKCVNSGSQNGNCYILENDTEALILDAGVRYKDVAEALNYDFSKVSGLLLTHEHFDHIKCAKGLMFRGVKCYGSDELQEFIETVMGEKIIALEEKKTYKIGSFKVTPMEIPHDQTHNFAYIIEFQDGSRILYATDFSYLPYRLASWHINFFLVECNHISDMVDTSEAKYKHSIRGHSELSTVCEMLKVNKTPDMRNVILCHLSEGWSDTDRMKQEIQEVVGKWVTVDVCKKDFQCELSKYPF